MRVGPIAFLVLIVGSWVLVRAWMLWPETVIPHSRPWIAWHPPLQSDPAAATPFGLSLSKPSLLVSVTRKGGHRQAQPERISGIREPYDLPVFAAEPASSTALEHPVAILSSPLSPRRPKLTVSAWSIIRSDTSPTLAAGGQLGGSQAGIRARYPIAPALHVAARLSAPLGSSRGKEAALAVDWRPIRPLPVTITAERRIGLDRGGRDAFAVGAFGGFDRVLPLGVRIDGYVQAGVVGARRRDAYADGSIRADMRVAPRIALGVGAWGGAQPGVSRLDIGPQIVVRARSLRLGAEWRARIAGNARPGSGPALSLGADF